MNAGCCGNPVLLGHMGTPACYYDASHPPTLHQVCIRCGRKAKGWPAEAAYQMLHRAGREDKKTEAQRAVLSQVSSTRSPLLAPNPGTSSRWKQRALSLLRLQKGPEGLCLALRPLPQWSFQKGRWCEQGLFFSKHIYIPMHLGHHSFSPYSIQPSKSKSAATSFRQPSFIICLKGTSLPFPHTHSAHSFYPDHLVLYIPLLQAIYSGPAWVGHQGFKT